jgi:hypothetical protein
MRRKVRSTASTIVELNTKVSPPRGPAAAAASLSPGRGQSNEVLKGDKYDRIRDDLRRRAASLSDQMMQTAKFTSDLLILQRKATTSTGQVRLAKEQAVTAGAEAAAEVTANERLRSELATREVDLQDLGDSLAFTTEQLEERELEVAKLRVQVQMVKEDLDARKTAKGGRATSPRPSFGRIRRAQTERDELARQLADVNEQLARQAERLSGLDALALVRPR